MNTSIARLVCEEQPSGDPGAVEHLLLDAFGARWPSGVKAKFALTPGGFVRGRWPSSWSGCTGWDSRKADLNPLVKEAEKQLGEIVTPSVLQAAKGKASVLAVGIDMDDDRVTEHAELVAIYDLQRGLDLTRSDPTDVCDILV